MLIIISSEVVFVDVGQCVDDGRVALIKRINVGALVCRFEHLLSS